MTERLDGTVVAIVGWAGATKRQLRTIDGWYRGRGARTIVVTPHVFRNMALPRGWMREGSALAEALRATSGPIAIHAFSNAGFWTTAALLRALDRATETRIAALILDSTPGFPPRLTADFTAHYSAMAMMPMLLRALRRKPALRDPVLDRPLRAFMRLWFYVSPRQIREAEASLEIVARRGAWPILVLYSARDSLVPAEHVEAFLGRLTGRDCTRVRWEDTEHVQHMIRHRHGYFAAVSALLSRASIVG